MSYRLLTDPSEIAALVLNGVEIEYTACHDPHFDQCDQYDAGGWINWGTDEHDVIDVPSLKKMLNECPRDRFRIKT